MFFINTIHTNVGVPNEIMVNVTSHSTINVSRTMDKKYICWVNDTTNNYTLDTSSIKVGGLTPDTVYSIGCVEVDEDGDYQCTEYNTTVVTGENLLVYTHSVSNKVAKVVGQMSEHFEFGLDIFNLGQTLFVWIFMPHNAM